MGGVHRQGPPANSPVSYTSSPSSLIPLKLSGDGIIIETSFKDGFRHETIRSNGTFLNATAVDLEVSASMTDLLDPSVLLGPSSP